VTHFVWYIRINALLCCDGAAGRVTGWDLVVWRLNQYRGKKPLEALLS